MRYHPAIPLKKAYPLITSGKNPFYPASEAEALRALNVNKKAGKEFYTGCGNEDINGRCAGHPDK